MGAVNRRGGPAAGGAMPPGRGDRDLEQREAALREELERREAALRGREQPPFVAVRRGERLPMDDDDELDDDEGPDDDEWGDDWDEPEERSAPKRRTAARNRGAYLGFAGLLALGAGVPLWLFGAVLTLDGWVSFINIMLALVGLPFAVPYADGWWRLLAIPVGFAYSHVEVRLRPYWPDWRSAEDVLSWLGFLVVLVIAHGSDNGTTWLGLAFPRGEANAIQAWAIDWVWPLLIWTGVVTYLPDRGIMWGAKTILPAGLYRWIANLRIFR